MPTKTKQFKVKNLRIPVVFQEEPEGGFTVIVPSLPGCVTFGKTIAHARLMVREAIGLYLEEMIAQGERVPSERAFYLSDVEVPIPARRMAAHV